MPALFGFIFAVLMLSGGAAKRQPTEGFSDVPKTHWAYEAVKDLKARGILLGYPPEAPKPAMRSAVGGKAGKPPYRNRRARHRARK